MHVIYDYRPTSLQLHEDFVASFLDLYLHHAWRGSIESGARGLED